jgi:tetratricopeptide (TPR) repeat protein
VSAPDAVNKEAGARSASVFDRLVYYHAEDICHSVAFRTKPLPQKLLKFIVLQTIRGQKTTETVLADFLSANSNKGDRENISENDVRQNVVRLRRLLNKYYESPDSATAIVAISIPPAGVDPQTGKRRHYEAIASVREVVGRNAQTFGAALHYKYGIPQEDGEAWFNTGEPPLSIVLYAANMEINRAVLTQLVCQTAILESPFENHFGLQFYTEYKITQITPELTAEHWFEKGWAASAADEKVRCYTEAIGLNSSYGPAYLQRGLTRLARGDCEGALQDFTEALLYGGDFEAYFYRGNARREKGDLEGAIVDYSESIRLRPDAAEAFCNRGIVRSAKGDLEGALEDYNEAIRLRPDAASDALNNRGVARRSKGDLEGALQDCNEAIRLNPHLTEALLNRGHTRCDIGDTEGALQDYNEVIRLNPDLTDALLSRAVTRHETGDTEGALRDVAEVLRLKPDFAIAFYCRANIRREMGDTEGALRDFTETIRLKPDFADAFHYRGLARQEHGDIGGAQQDFTEAIRLGYSEET